MAAEAAFCHLVWALCVPAALQVQMTVQGTSSETCYMDADKHLCKLLCHTKSARQWGDGAQLCTWVCLAGVSHVSSEVPSSSDKSMGMKVCASMMSCIQCTTNSNSLVCGSGITLNLWMSLVVGGLHVEH